jgi:hypothetical protein
MDDLARQYATGVHAAKPKVAARIGEAAAERWVRRCIEQAEQYALRSRRFGAARSCEG